MKRFQDLTLKDNFMFCTAMVEGDNCKQLLELVLEMPIKEVKIDSEKTQTYHPDYHGIRLDIIAEDENSTRYNVEMQVLRTPLAKRSRYYHSQIDMDILKSGEEYEKLPDVYVIFICDFDPFGYHKYKYTKTSICLEEPRLDLSDGSHTIFLSTRGKNDGDVSKELVKFLKFVKEGPLEPIVDDNPTSYVQILQNSINKIKADRSMEERFMLLEEMLRQERKEGLAEGRKEGLEKGLTEGRKEGHHLGVGYALRSTIVHILNRNGSYSNEIEEILNRIDSEEKLNQVVDYVLTADDAEDVKKFLQSLS